MVSRVPKVLMDTPQCFTQCCRHVLGELDAGHIVARCCCQVTLIVGHVVLPRGLGSSVVSRLKPYASISILVPLNHSLAESAGVHPCSFGVSTLSGSMFMASMTSPGELLHQVGIGGHDLGWFPEPTAIRDGPQVITAHVQMGRDHMFTLHKALHRWICPHVRVLGVLEHHLVAH